MTFSHDKGRNARAHAVQALRSGGSLAKPIGKKYDRSIVMPIYLVLLVIFLGTRASQLDVFFQSVRGFGTGQLHCKRGQRHLSDPNGP